jgi:hypothetical protein
MNEGKITILLPFYWHEYFLPIYEKGLGYNALWSPNREDYEKLICANNIDIALEHQGGLYDFPIRDIMAETGRVFPIILLLNWNGKALNEYRELGYVDTLEIPGTIGLIREKIETNVAYYRKNPDKIPKPPFPRCRKENVIRVIPPERRS